ncbi:MAG: hypothetical protein A2Y48_03750 [Nitrospirae bacterium RIFCSPLOW2_12_42_9]|nr:MAG: hypothetical protein A2Y48_03750 [Nitrospirae bacterium RIFCSPLOW2_12_42_9]
MNCEVKENKILIHQAELDIYDTQVLKEKISAVAAANNNSVILDLQRVEAISTPVIQVLMAAKKGITDFRILNINDGVTMNLNLFGFSL